MPALHRTETVILQTRVAGLETIILEQICSDSEKILYSTLIWICFIYFANLVGRRRDCLVIFLQNNRTPNSHTQMNCFAASVRCTWYSPLASFLFFTVRDTRNEVPCLHSVKSEEPERDALRTCPRDIVWTQLFVRCSFKWAVTLQKSLWSPPVYH